MYLNKKYKVAYLGTDIRAQAMNQMCLLFQMADKFTKRSSLAFVVIFSVASAWLIKRWDVWKQQGELQSSFPVRRFKKSLLAIWSNCHSLLPSRHVCQDKQFNCSPAFLSLNLGQKKNWIMQDDVCAKLLQTLCETGEKYVFVTQTSGLWFQQD